MARNRIICSEAGVSLTAVSSCRHLLEESRTSNMINWTGKYTEKNTCEENVPQLMNTNMYLLFLPDRHMCVSRPPSHVPFSLKRDIHANQEWSIQQSLTAYQRSYKDACASETGVWSSRNHMPSLQITLTPALQSTNNNTMMVVMMMKKMT